MTRKITSIRVDVRSGKVKVRTQSKSLRGTGFTLAGVEAQVNTSDRLLVKAAILSLLKEVMPQSD